jgi:hypothetical protein
LADYFLRQGFFGRTRETFEEALARGVANAREFGVVFNAYMKFEEQMIEAEIEEEGGGSDENDDEQDE